MRQRAGQQELVAHSDSGSHPEDVVEVEESPAKKRRKPGRPPGTGGGAYLRSWMRQIQLPSESSEGHEGAISTTSTATAMAMALRDNNIVNTEPQTNAVATAFGLPLQHPV